MKFSVLLMMCCAAGAYSLGASSVASQEIRQGAQADYSKVKKLDPAAMKASEDLLKAMSAKENHTKTINQMLDMQISQSPKLKPMRGAMDKFFQKHMGWDSMKPEIMKIYAKRFTAAEIMEITRFYRTPTGQKAVRLLPEISTEAAQIGQRRIQSNVGELMQLLQQRKGNRQ